MNDSVLPHVNAALNALSFLLLVAAFYQIRRGDVQAHRRLMLSALAVSCLFLVCYVTYHAQYGSVRFTGQGAVRAVYFFILITHIILAAAIVPLVVGWFRRHAEERARTLTPGQVAALDCGEDERGGARVSPG